MLHGMYGLNSNDWVDLWYACSLCTVWVLSPMQYIDFYAMPFSLSYLDYYILSHCGLFVLVCILFAVIMCKFGFRLTYNITWLFSVVFVDDIAWCIYYRDYGLHFGGGSYSSVYVPPPMCVFH